jgi:hypothetical protein
VPLYKEQGVVLRSVKLGKGRQDRDDRFQLEGGDGGTRTRDFLPAKQVLYQLSYVPVRMREE